MATTEEIGEVLARLIAAYPNAHVDDKSSTIREYAKRLKDIPGNVLKEAAETCMDNDEWFPTIAKLRKEATNIDGGWRYAKYNSRRSDG